MKKLNDVHTENWKKLLEDNLKECSNLYLISPFINSHAVNYLLGLKLKNIKVITRYKIDDFIVGVSDLNALKLLFKNKAEIRGIQDLHSKVYIFDNKKVIVSSANFTKSGITKNIEFGIVSTDPYIINETSNYFKKLWEIGRHNLDTETLKEFGIEIRAEKSKRKKQNKYKISSSDFGQRKELNNELLSVEPKQTSDTGRAYIKFFGTHAKRLEKSKKILDVVKKTECHYATTFREGKRPREIKQNETIYIAYMLKPNDYAIFGKAKAIAHIDDRDNASNNEKERKSWKKKWPHYIRIFNPVFINGKLSDGISLYGLTDKFKNLTFQTTARNTINKKGNTDPRKSLRQQAGVMLTPVVAEEVEKLFKDKINKLGYISDTEIDKLPKPDFVERLGEDYFKKEW